jgi:hypothetical protein
MQTTATVGIQIVRAAQQMGFFAFIFSALFSLFNALLNDWTAQPGWLSSRWVRVLCRTVVFVALFLFVMKSAWFHNFLIKTVAPWLATENYPPAG